MPGYLLYQATKYKFNLGQTDNLLHKIALKTEEPIYAKKSKIPDVYREEVGKHVAEWLKLCNIQPARSKFNSSIFALAKKHSGIRQVQDFRALNKVLRLTRLPCTHRGVQSFI
jgi:hypothetical protein